MQRPTGTTLTFNVLRPSIRQEQAMNEPDPPQTSGARNVRAARNSPLATTLALFPGLRTWARDGLLDAHVAEVRSDYDEQWLGNLAPLEWETSVPTVGVDPACLGPAAQAIGRLDAAFHRALVFEPTTDGRAVLARSQDGKFVVSLEVFSDQRRGDLEKATRRRAGEGSRRPLIPAADVERVVTIAPGTVVWSIEPRDLRVDDTGAPWLVACGDAPSYGPFGMNLADVVSRLGRYKPTCAVLRDAVDHYNKGLTAVLDAGAPYLTEPKFAVLTEMAATGPVGNYVGEPEQWAAVRPEGFAMLVRLGLMNLRALGNAS
jgi:hypothetical protein